MTEALRTIRVFGFGRMEFNRVKAVVHPDNLASRRVIEKVGMLQEGRLRQVATIDGLFQDHLMYAVLRSDWVKSPS